MILVTGGTGLLGSHLLLHLTLSGKTVRAIKRSSSNVETVRKVFSYYVDNPDVLMSRISWIEGDLMDFPSMREALQGISEVYHVGAVVSFYPKDHPAMLRVNIEGTANLVNMAIEHGISKFCYVSSVATLGRAENNGVSTEETFWVPSKRNSVYSISKYGAEREVWRGMEEGLNAVIVNPSVIVGPGFWNDNSGLFRLVWKGLKYYTRGVNGYIDVRDICRAMTGLMDNNHFGQRYICSAENLSYQDFFTRIAYYYHKPAPSVNVPNFLTAFAWRVEAIRSFLTGSKPEVTREMAITTTMNYTYSSQKLIQTLDFSFTPIEHSIRDTCGFFMKDMGITLE